MSTKICKGCGIEKLIENYHINKRMKDGHLNYCKSCANEKIIIYNRNNPELTRAKNKIQSEKPEVKKRKILNTFKKRQSIDGYRAAHNAVSKAISKGIIKRKPCEMCGNTEHVHAHHDDYMQPLDVMWLCVSHHKARHSFLTFINKEIF